MYYRKNDKPVDSIVVKENYITESYNNSSKNCKFPLWLLIIIIVLIITIGIFLVLRFMDKKKSTQNFGYKFY